MSIVYLGLGSNRDNPVRQLGTALSSIAQLDQVAVARVSSFYQSQPWGELDQPEFVNAVAKIITSLPPLALLAALQLIEKQQKRVRLVRWGPRTIDLDILLFDQLELNLAELVVPHPLLLQREFVVYPLHEIAPCLQLPSGEFLADYKARLPARGIRQLPLELGELS